MNIEKIGNDNIEIKSLPSITTVDKPQELTQIVKSMNNGKISGGIFPEGSIKFIKGEMPDVSHFKPDVRVSYNPQSKKGGNNGGGDDGMSDLERRVQNLEYESQKIREQLSEIKSQNAVIVSKLDNSISKSDLLTFQTTINSAINNIPSISDIKNTVREIIKEDNISSTNDIKLIISDEMKNVPTTNDIKNIFNDSITERKLTSETKVENMLNAQKSSTIKYLIGTGIAIVAAIAGVLKLFF